MALANERRPVDPEIDESLILWERKRWYCCCFGWQRPLGVAGWKDGQGRRAEGKHPGTEAYRLAMAGDPAAIKDWEWSILVTENTDAEGWQYARCFWLRIGQLRLGGRSNEKMLDCVKRRQWVRKDHAEELLRKAKKGAVHLMDPVQLAAQQQEAKEKTKEGYDQIKEILTQLDNTMNIKSMATALLDPVAMRSVAKTHSKIMKALQARAIHELQPAPLPTDEVWGALAVAPASRKPGFHMDALKNTVNNILNRIPLIPHDRAERKHSKNLGSPVATRGTRGLPDLSDTPRGASPAISRAPSAAVALPDPPSLHPHASAPRSAAAPTASIVDGRSAAAPTPAVRSPEPAGSTSALGTPSGTSPVAHTQQGSQAGSLEPGIPLVGATATATAVANAAGTAATTAMAEVVTSDGAGDSGTVRTAAVVSVVNGVGAAVARPDSTGTAAEDTSGAAAAVGIAVAAEDVSQPAPDTSLGRTSDPKPPAPSSTADTHTPAAGSTIGTHPPVPSGTQPGPRGKPPLSRLGPAHHPPVQPTSSPSPDASVQHNPLAPTPSEAPSESSGHPATTVQTSAYSTPAPFHRPLMARDAEISFQPSTGATASMVMLPEREDVRSAATPAQPQPAQPSDQRKIIKKPTLPLLRNMSLQHPAEPPKPSGHSILGRLGSGRFMRALKGKGGAFQGPGTPTSSPNQPPLSPTPVKGGPLPSPSPHRMTLSLIELECATGHAMSIYGDLEEYIGSMPNQNHYESIEKYTGVPYQDVTMAVWRSQPFRPAHYVALDRDKSKIVVCIRGTMEFVDTITDLVGVPIAYDFGPGLFGIVHRGILEAAQAIVASVVDDVLEAAAQHPEYDVLITGHSLGGGASGLVALLLRMDTRLALHQRARLRAICLAPAAVMNKNLSLACQSFIVSIVYRNDLVPRTDVASTAKFVTEVAQASPLKRALLALWKACNLAPKEAPKPSNPSATATESSALSGKAMMDAVTAAVRLTSSSAEAAATAAGSMTAAATGSVTAAATVATESVMAAATAATGSVSAAATAAVEAMASATAAAGAMASSATGSVTAAATAMVAATATAVATAHTTTTSVPPAAVSGTVKGSSEAPSNDTLVAGRPGAISIITTDASDAVTSKDADAAVMSTTAEITSMDMATIVVKEATSDAMASKADKLSVVGPGVDTKQESVNDAVATGPQQQQQATPVSDRPHVTADVELVLLRPGTQQAAAKQLETEVPQGPALSQAKPGLASIPSTDAQQRVETAVDEQEAALQVAADELQEALASPGPAGAAGTPRAAQAGQSGAGEVRHPHDKQAAAQALRRVRNAMKMLRVLQKTPQAAPEAPTPAADAEIQEQATNDMHEALGMLQDVMVAQHRRSTSFHQVAPPLSATPSTTTGAAPAASVKSVETELTAAAAAAAASAAETAPVTATAEVAPGAAAASVAPGAITGRGGAPAAPTAPATPTAPAAPTAPGAPTAPAPPTAPAAPTGSTSGGGADTGCAPAAPEVVGNASGAKSSSVPVSVSAGVPSANRTLLQPLLPPGSVLWLLPDPRPASKKKQALSLLHRIRDGHVPEAPEDTRAPASLAMMGSFMEDLTPGLAQADGQATAPGKVEEEEEEGKQLVLLQADPSWFSDLLFFSKALTDHLPLSYHKALNTHIANTKKQLGRRRLHLARVSLNP